MTGQWEKKLRDIEKGSFAASQFIDELKQMVGSVVHEVMKQNPTRRIVEIAPQKQETEKPKRKSTKKVEIKEGAPCPKCGKGVIIKGRTAYGCSLWREGCDWRQPFE